MTKILLVISIVLLAALGGFPVGSGSLCLIAQEKETKDGEWCQRAVPRMSKKAHACTCHQHACDKDPRDPNNLSAHTDPMCLNFCHTGKCLCSAIDCP